MKNIGTKKTLVDVVKVVSLSMPYRILTNFLSIHKSAITAAIGKKDMYTCASLLL